MVLAATIGYGPRRRAWGLAITAAVADDFPAFELIRVAALGLSSVPAFICCAAAR